MDGLRDQPRSGRPRQFAPTTVAEVKALACELPANSEIPLAKWSCPELTREAIARGLVVPVSASTVRRWLAKDAIIKPWQHRTWIFPRDPQLRHDDVYRNKAEYAVVFASANYASKLWTSHERRSAQARASMEKRAYLLPVRLDETEIPGLLPTIAYIDGKSTSPRQLAELIKAKVGGAVVKSISEPFYGVPLTLDEKRQLLSHRPEGWEYLLVAGLLWQAFNDLKCEVPRSRTRLCEIHKPCRRQGSAFPTYWRSR